MRTSPIFVAVGLALGAMSAAILPSVAQSSAQTYTYPPAVVNAYIEACIQDRSLPRSFCECTISKLQRTMSFSEFMAFGRDLMQDPQAATPMAFSGAVAACTPTRKQGRTPIPLASRPKPYPLEVVTAFKEGCEKSRKGSAAFCQCSIDEIQKRVSFQDFYQWIAVFKKTDTVPAPIRESILFCSLEYQLSDTRGFDAFGPHAQSSSLSAKIKKPDLTGF